MRTLIFVLLTGALPGTAQDLARGKRLYDFHCAFCHGKGDDGMAANLVSPKLVHAPTDAALEAIIRNGIPGSDMPAALGMTDTEIREVAVYVRSLGRSAPVTVPGDAAAGAKTYANACAGCHGAKAEGGSLGPALKSIGLQRSPAALRTAIVDPDAAIAPAWVSAQVTMKGGRKLSGIRLNEDNFSIYLRDGAGRIHALNKAETAQIDRGLKRSAMPGFQSRLTDAQLTDLVAYLFTLRGE
jgi:putative heme-binding domain-containing protein